jgi:hypothetical protein
MYMCGTNSTSPFAGVQQVEGETFALGYCTDGATGLEDCRIGLYMHNIYICSKKLDGLQCEGLFAGYQHIM